MNNRKSKISILAFFLIQFLFVNYSVSQVKFCISKNYTPVLHTSDYSSVFGGASGSEIKLNDAGLIGEMEFIAYPNTVFEITEEIPFLNYSIFKVKTDDYPYNSSPLYIDSRFVTISDVKPIQRKAALPPPEQIADNLKSLKGYPYMWGGNYAYGIWEMLDYYQPKSEIEGQTKSLWIMKGVDCSGLIYQATGGYTPRNTSSLINYGNAVEIEGKTFDEILSMLKPLDLIAWNGHVIIVLDGDNTIESTPASGVHTSELRARLKEIVKTKKPVNDWKSSTGNRFVVRRFI